MYLDVLQKYQHSITYTPSDYRRQRKRPLNLVHISHLVNQETSHVQHIIRYYHRIISDLPEVKAASKQQKLTMVKYDSYFQ